LYYSIYCTKDSTYCTTYCTIESTCENACLQRGVLALVGGTHDCELALLVGQLLLQRLALALQPRCLLVCAR